MKSEVFVKKVYVSEIEDPRRRGKPVVRCMHEKVADKDGRD